MVIEGFKEAAQEFVVEAGLEEVADVNQLDLGSIDYRLRVRQAIQSGQISVAVQELNNFDPEILDSSPSVYFHLRLQELLEKIRFLKQNQQQPEDEMSAILKVIDFAREFLAPVAQEQAGGAYLEELEEVMGLLAADLGASWPADALLLPENRLKTAKEVNSAILASQAQPEQSKLPEILSLLNWAQERLAERANFPKLIDPVSGTFDQ